MTGINVKPDLELFHADPLQFLENVTREYLATSPDNRLSAFKDIPLFEDALVGCADGDDAIFQDYKEIIGGFHLTPREAMAIHQQGRADSVEKQPPRLSVISWILTAPREVRVSLRRETVIASVLVNHATWEGKDFLHDKLMTYLISLLEGLGHQAVAPSLADFFKWIDTPDGPTSNWSEKHVAYAAGLGSFGLNAGLITPKGVAIHCVSVVTDLALPASPRLYEDHLANCLFYRDGTCRRCIERCPSGALSEQGYDKQRCLDYHQREQPEIWKQLGRGDYIGLDPSCGLCQTKVPCEDRIPPIIAGKNR